MNATYVFNHVYMMTYLFSAVRVVTDRVIVVTNNHVQPK
jgi:hypothetical protein